MKKLKKPFLFPNPYLPQPELPAAPAAQTTTSVSTVPSDGARASVPGKIISDTKSTSDERIPSLTELCLRALLSPPIDVDVDGDETAPSVLSSSQSSQPLSSRAKTRLEQTYELPLAAGANSRALSSSVRQILGVCVPGSILLDRNSATSPGSSQSSNAHDHDLLATDLDSALPEDESRTITGTGVCPNPAHGLLPSVFVHHAEERFTWETSTPVVATLGGAVAVLWRGCMRGCLDFLEPPRLKAVEVQPPEGDASSALSNLDTQHTEGEDMNLDLDLDEADIVQAFAISTEPLGFE